MSRNDRQDQLLDYLYDELSPTQREAFEREMQSDEALRQEVEAFQSTRLMMKRAEPEEAPVAIFNDLMRQARHAAAAATEEKPGFFARLAALLMQPAAATAALAVVLTVTGIYLARQDNSPAGSGTAAPSLADNRDYNDDDTDDLTAGDLAAADRAIAPEPEAEVANARGGEEPDPTTTLALAEDGERGEDKVAPGGGEADETVAQRKGNDGWGLFRRDGRAGSDRPNAEAPEAPTARKELESAVAQAVVPAMDEDDAPAEKVKAEESKPKARRKVAAVPIPSPRAAGFGGAGSRKAKVRTKKARPTAGDSLDDGLSVAVGALPEDTKAATANKPATPSKPVADAEEAEPADQEARARDSRRAVESQSAVQKRQLNLGNTQAKTAEAPPSAPSAGRAELREGEAREQAPVVADIQQAAQPAPTRRVTSVRRGGDKAPSQVVYGDKRPTRASTPMPKQAPEAAPQEVSRKADGGPVAQKAEVSGAAEAGKTNKKDSKASGYDRAMAHYRQKRYSKAIGEFESYLDENKGSSRTADVQLKLAKSYTRTNRLAQAAARYRKLLADNPTYSGRSAVLIELARLESLMGNLAGARSLLKEAAKDKSVEAKAKARLAEIERRLEERAAAKKRAAKKKKSADQATEPAKAAPAAKSHTLY